MKLKGYRKDINNKLTKAQYLSMIGGNIISQNTYMLSTAKYSYLRDIVTCEDSGINPFEMKY